jgi:hypothetical protein
MAALAWFSWAFLIAKINAMLPKDKVAIVQPDIMYP